MTTQADSDEAAPVPDATSGAVGAGPRTPRERVLRSWARNGIVVALVLEIALFAIVADGFTSPSNIQVILLQSAIVGMLVVPSAIVLMAGYVDLSVGSMVGLSAVLFGQVATRTEQIGLAVVVGLVAATAIGALNGWLSAYLKFSPIVVTLGTLAAVRGICLVVSDGKSTSRFGDTFALLGRGRVHFHGVGFELPIPVLIAAGVFVLGAVFLYETVWGRHVVALGSNPTAAFHAGIRVDLLPFTLYVVTGAIAGLAGLVLAARLNTAPPAGGEGLEIDVLTAVLLGGVAFGGGRGTLLGVLAGVLFIAALGNGLVLSGVSPFWVRVSSGCALLLAAGLDAFNRWSAARRGGGGAGRARLSLGRRG